MSYKTDRSNANERLDLPVYEHQTIPISVVGHISDKCTIVLLIERLKSLHRQASALV
jgi:hypothetical protein